MEIPSQIHVLSHHHFQQQKSPLRRSSHAVILHPYWQIGYLFYFVIGLGNERINTISKTILSFQQEDKHQEARNQMRECIGVKKIKLELCGPFQTCSFMFPPSQFPKETTHAFLIHL
jgi:hypothetical protein